jgi:hypothetical protein
VEEIALRHDARLTVDCTRVYHFGARCKLECKHSSVVVLLRCLDVRSYECRAHCVPYKIAVAGF